MFPFLGVIEAIWTDYLNVISCPNDKMLINNEAEGWSYNVIISLLTLLKVQNTKSKVKFRYYVNKRSTKLTYSFTG